MWPRRLLIAQLCWLDSDAPDAVQRAGARTTQADGNIEPIHDEPKQGGR
jgi:hypothetical protein